jgi:hypothetical protein
MGYYLELEFAIFNTTREFNTKIQGLSLGLSGSGHNRVNPIMTRL